MLPKHTIFKTIPLKMVVLLSMVMSFGIASAQLVISPGATASQLISAFAGQGLVVSNLTINCNAQAYGTFTNSGGNLAMANGMLLTSGFATNAQGPNSSNGISACIGTQFNDAQLLAIDNRAKYDACIIQFDIVPQCNSIQIKFVFGSDEYPEWVSATFNDAFGFFITGPGPNCSGPAYNNTNVATLPNNVTPVTIDNVNSFTNSSYYVNNPSNSTVQYDGMTTALTRTVTLCPCQSYHFKIAIADASDCAYDSGVFVDFIQCSNPLAGIATAVAPVCGCTGSATATPSGGLPPYSYLWSNGQTTSTINNLCPGNYTCTLNDQLSCTVPKVVNVTVPTSASAITLSTSQTNVTCFGGTNGTATVNPSGMAGPYTYSWSPSGQTGQTATNLAAGVYTVTVSASGCNNQTTVTITEPPVLTATQSQTNALCNGVCNGIATVNPAGGNGTYSYSWAPSGGNAVTASNLCAGNYTCTITSGVGCSIAKIFTITEPPLLTATQSQTNVSCFGGTNGTATVTPSGGNGGNSFAWSPSGGNAATANGLAAGNYTCTITDLNGCNITKNFTINQPPQVTASQSSTNVTCNGVCDGTATVSGMAGGTGAYSYSWTPSGGNGVVANALCAGNYVCTISDANACSITKNITITQPILLTASITNTVDASCFGYTDGSATAAGGGGTSPYTYSWSNGDLVSTASNLPVGNQTVTVTDAHNCTATAIATIYQPSTFSVSVTATTNVSCFGGNDGTATASPSGGTPNYSFTWTSGGGNAPIGTNFLAGNYTVTATDGQGCNATANATITEPTLLTATISATTDVSCFAGNDGTATVLATGGTSPYSYSWTNGNLVATATVLSLGNYTATVTDNKGCTATAIATINEPTLLTLSITSTSDVSCFGGNDGSAVSLASGGTLPYSYSWTNGDLIATASNLIAGNYTVTATDAEGCTATAIASITEPTLLTASITNTIDVSCFGYTDGSATGAGSGGTLPYTYSWTNGDLITTAVNLPAGNHIITVTDALNCTATAVANITQPSSFTVSIIATTNVSCFGGNDGTATALGNGGTPNFTYSWSGGGGNSAIGTNFPAGNYTVTATDGQGCNATENTTITEPNLLTATISATTDVSCFGGNDGTATVLAAGGTSPYTYSWTNGDGLSTSTSLPLGNYTAIVTDALGCTATAIATINEPTLLTVAITSTVDVSCFGGNDGSAISLASGGTSPYSYSWTNGDLVATASNLIAGNYSVTATDAEGCTTTAIATLTEPTLLTASITNTIDVSCFGYTDGSATGAGSGGTLPYTYSWTNGDLVSTSTNLPAGNHTITVTDAHNCTAMAVAIITQPSAFTVAITATTNVSCFGGNDGAATALGNGGTPNYTYAWTPVGGSTANGSGFTVGNFIVTATDGQGCTATAIANITEPALLVETISATTNVSCFGGNDGTATIGVSGGTFPFTNVWTNGQTNTQIATGLSAGNYTSTLTDAKGCTATAIANITEPPLLSVSIVSTDDVNCFGGNDGSAVSLAIGGTSPINYSWTNGDLQPTSINLPIGNFTVTVTDAKNCTATAIATINEPALLTATISNTVDATCFSYTDGSATVLANGGFGAYTYLWTNGDMIDNAVNLPAGNHTATVTDANGCTATAMSTVAEPPPFTVAVTATNDVSCFGGNDGTATALANGGTPNYSYNWLPIGGATANGSGFTVGTFTVTATDNLGCTATADATINEPTLLTATISVSTDVSCFGGNDGTATVSISGGTAAYTILWPSGGNTLTETSLAMGNYTVTITDALGCNTNTTATINEPTVLTAAVDATTNATCFGFGDGTADFSAAGGTPTYSFIWPDGTNSPTGANLIPGNYLLNVYDLNSCTTTLNFTITEPSVLQFTNTNIIDASCFGVSNGAVDITVGGGTLPYSYVWTSTDPAYGGLSEDLLSLPAGDYTVVVSDGYNCTITQTSSVVQPTALEIDTNSVNASCFGSSDGQATVTVLGSMPPYTYSWNSGGNQATLSGISAGVYTVIITDAQNCQATETVTITEPTLLEGLISSENVSCFGFSNGSVAYELTGGTPPYITIWNNGEISGSITNLVAGVYSVSATDANNCPISASAEVTEPDALVAEITSENDILGMQDFEITSNVFGGTPGYQYQWLPDSLADCSVCDTFVGKVNEDTEIILQVSDINNCVTADTVLIRIIDNVIYVPNAFSPNADGMNETFKAYAPPGTAEFSMRIFDRWGQQHFLSNDIGVGWDGKVKGQVKVDVYVYKITLKYPNGKVKNLTGTVTLM